MKERRNLFSVQRIKFLHRRAKLSESRKIPCMDGKNFP